MENIDEKSTTTFKFEDLRIYKKSLGYSQWIFDKLSIAKTPLQIKLATEFYQASVAISLNIAEGSYRPSKQFEHLLKVSKTTIRECITYSSLAYSSNLFSKETYDESRKTLLELTKMLCAFLQSIQKNQKTDIEPNSEREVAFNAFPLN